MSKNFPNLSNKANDKVEETIVKSKNPNKRTSTTIGETQANPGDNARYLKHALAIYNLPPINTADADAVKERIFWYFNHCMENDTKPTVNGLALAIGVKRQVLWNWANGIDRAETHQEFVKKAYQIMEVMWEEYMQNGKINPVSGIFLGKNHFGYADKSEVVLTPNNKLGTTENPEDIRRKYLAEGSDSIEYLAEGVDNGEDT